MVKGTQPTNRSLSSKTVPSVPEGELERLQGIITTLKEEIGTLVIQFIVGMLTLSLQLALRKNP